MSSAERVRRTARVVVAAVIAVAAGLATAPSASAEEVYPRPAGTTIDFLGHGWGHGNGMSQYGSLGGAQAGKTWQQILAHYYTGTTLGSIGSPTIRVRVASLGSSVQANPATGLRVTWDLTNSSVAADHAQRHHDRALADRARHEVAGTRPGSSCSTCPPGRRRGRTTRPRRSPAPGRSSTRPAAP